MCLPIFTFDSVVAKRTGYFNYCEPCVTYYALRRRPAIKVSSSTGLEQEATVLIPLGVAQDYDCWEQQARKGYCLTRDRLGNYDGLPEGQKMAPFGPYSELSEPPRWKYASNVTTVETGMERYRHFQNLRAHAREHPLSVSHHHHRPQW